MSDQKINIVDVATLANFFEVEERTIQNWVSINGAPRSSRGEYDFIQFIKWRLRYLENEKKILEAGGSKKAEAELEGINLQNIQRKQKIDYEAKRLVNYADVKIAWTQEYVVLNSALKNLEFNITGMLRGVLSPEQTEALQKEFIEARNQLGAELRIEDEVDDEDFNDTKDE